MLWTQNDRDCTARSVQTNEDGGVGWKFGGCESQRACTPHFGDFRV